MNGFILASVDEAVAAVQAGAGMDRRPRRRVFEQRFSAARMAKDDIRVCEHLADRAASSDGRAVRQTASRG